MRFLTIAMSIFSSLLLAQSALAAKVEVESGEAFIDKGQGYTAIAGSTAVKVGDVIMATAGGRAVIVYDDGCRKVVEVGEVQTVGEVSPCASGQSQAPTSTSYVLLGLGVAAAAAAIFAATSDDSDGDKCITKCN